MHITLIHPPRIFYNASEIIYPQCLGLLYIAANLRAAGHTVCFIDGVYEGKSQIKRLSTGFLKVGLSFDEIIKRIDNNTQLIGISIGLSYYAQLGHDLIQRIKKTFPSIPVVMGGVYPSTQPELAITSEADYLCLGEGEEAIVELAKYLTGQKQELPLGIIARLNSKGLATASPVFVKNLDILPFPARDIVPFIDYMKFSPIASGYRGAVVSTSRGCPYTCTFCAIHSVNGYVYRARSAKNILTEIQHLIDYYQVNLIDIIDDNFTLDKARVVDILNGIIEINKKHKLAWSNSNGIMLQTIDEELFDLFARSNCIHLGIALEHGDETMLKLMNKNYNLTKAKQIIEYAKKYSIQLDIHVVYGYPGEKEENFMKGLAYYRRLKKINPYVKFKLMMAQPFPKTALYDLCIQKGYIDKNLCRTIDKNVMMLSDYTAHIETADFSQQEIIRRGRFLRWSLDLGLFIKVEIKEKFPELIVWFLRKLYYQISIFRNMFQR